MTAAKTVAVLAVQGAFIEHERVLNVLGANTIELRQSSDLQNHFDALVLPGGESTAQTKMLRELNMLEPLKKRIEEGMPVLATCAGLILLANTFETLPVTVKRNAYGRQLGSFRTIGKWDGKDIPMTFIRAPYIDSVREPQVAEACSKGGAPAKNATNVYIKAQVDGHIVGVQYQSQIAVAFHPELDGDITIHTEFLSLI